MVRLVKIGSVIMLCEVYNVVGNSFMYYRTVPFEILYMICATVAFLKTKHDWGKLPSRTSRRFTSQFSPNQTL